MIFHLDMDAFYASIEQRDQPRLRGRPVIVGSPPDQRGVVAASSYEARKFGVRSAMPSSTAKRLCPQGVFIYPRMQHYRQVSAEIMALVTQFTSLVEQVSIDEAYLDLSHLCQGEDADASLLQALPLARQLQQSIFEQCQLTASIGIASNKFLAKLASDFNKPKGLTLIPERDKILFLRPLPVRTIHGVGEVTEKNLIDAGLKTIGDLQDYKLDLRHLVGSFGSTLYQFAFGQDSRPLQTEEETKSVSAEETFLRDTDDRAILRPCLKLQALEIAARLKEKNLAATTVQVKVRYADFTTLTRQMTLQTPIMEAREIYKMGCFLLAKEKLVTRPLRLLGLGTANLVSPTVRQLTFEFIKESSVPKTG